MSRGIYLITLVVIFCVDTNVALREENLRQSSSSSQRIVPSALSDDESLVQIDKGTLAFVVAETKETLPTTNGSNSIVYTVQTVPAKNEDDSCYVNNGETYRGSEDTSRGGIKCLPWKGKSLSDYHIFTPSDFQSAGLADGSYCRNPGGILNAPWCFVADPSGLLTWDYCDIGVCVDSLYKCYDGSGGSYRGIQSTTVSGKTCQNWLSTSPHNQPYSVGNYSTKGIGDHNYCRNPEGYGAPWCYTTDPNTRWEYCFPIDCLNEVNQPKCLVGPWGPWGDCISTGNETALDGTILSKVTRKRTVTAAPGYTLYDCTGFTVAQKRLC